MLNKQSRTSLLITKVKYQQLNHNKKAVAENEKLTAELKN